MPHILDGSLSRPRPFSVLLCVLLKIFSLIERGTLTQLSFNVPIQEPILMLADLPLFARSLQPVLAGTASSRYTNGA